MEPRGFVQQATALFAHRDTPWQKSAYTEDLRDTRTIAETWFLQLRTWGNLLAIACCQLPFLFCFFIKPLAKVNF